ncbi:MAG: hypothetical protein IPL35_08210 [Sphingobacteriales bacterium]|nr:hypothetical protein [Sphingobacteriales bacterium]
MKNIPLISSLWICRFTTMLCCLFFFANTQAQRRDPDAMPIRGEVIYICDKQTQQQAAQAIDDYAELIVEATVIAESDTLYLPAQNHDPYYHPQAPYLLQTLKVHRLFKGKLHSDTLQIITYSTIRAKKYQKFKGMKDSLEMVGGFYHPDGSKKGESGIFMIKSIDKNEAALQAFASKKDKRITVHTLFLPTHFIYETYGNTGFLWDDKRHIPLDYCKNEVDLSTKLISFYINNDTYIFPNIKTLYTSLGRKLEKTTVVYENMYFDKIKKRRCGRKKH